MVLLLIVASKVVNACLKSSLCLKWHSIGTLLVRTKPPVALIESISVRSNGECGLHAQVNPIVDKGLRLDDFSISRIRNVSS